MEISKLYKMRLHEVIYTDNFEITRVPGGWIYARLNYENERVENSLSCFVPFNNEFQG